jgi:hypothetical protein
MGIRRVKQFENHPFASELKRLSERSVEKPSKLTTQMFEEAIADFDAGRVITVKELAAKLRVCENTARKMAKKDPTVLRGGIIRIPASAERRILRSKMDNAA